MHIGNNNYNSFILPAKDIGDEIQSLTEIFLKSKRDLKSNLTTVEVHRIIEAIIHEYIDRQSCWVANPATLDDALADIFPWFSDQELADDYLVHIDQTMMSLYHYLGLFIKNNTWDVWTIKAFHEDIIITHCGDYRALEFERLVLSGDIVTTSRVKRSIANV